MVITHVFRNLQNIFQNFFLVALEVDDKKEQFDLLDYMIVGNAK